MNAKQAAVLVALNAALCLILLAGYALWLAPAPAPKLAVLDVGELYRLQEQQVAAVLVKRETSEAERASALARVAAFGQEVSALLESLPEECDCLLLARGAVVGPAPLLPDLTPEARRRLGL
jgi:hypothetical protein